MHQGFSGKNEIAVSSINIIMNKKGFKRNHGVNVCSKIGGFRGKIDNFFSFFIGFLRKPTDQGRTT